MWASSISPHTWYSFVYYSNFLCLCLFLFHKCEPGLFHLTTHLVFLCLFLWQRKRAQRCDSSGSDSAEVTMCTLVWQRRQLTVLRQRCHLPLLSQWCKHRCHTTCNVNIAVTALSVETAVTTLSVVTAVTLVCTVMLHCCHCYRCCTVVSLHRWHTNVAAISVTVLSRPLLSQHS